jgi:hypothetical protein
VEVGVVDVGELLCLLTEDDAEEDEEESDAEADVVGELAALLLTPRQISRKALTASSAF